jgi:septum formation protein
MKIILGSKSPGRKKVLQAMGYEFEVMVSDFDEKSIRDTNPVNLVLKLAHAKARTLLAQIKKPAILITSDQVVLCDDKILEKPADNREAEQYLRWYMDHPAETITAVVVVNTATHQQIDGVDIAKVHFRHIPGKMIKKIAAQEYVVHCAGGFSLDDKLLRKYIARIEGSEDSVTGLPISLTKRLIRASLLGGRAFYCP